MEQRTVYDSDTTATDLESNDVALYPGSSPPTSLEAPISPPPLKRRKTALESDRKQPPRPETDCSKNLSHLAAIEAGEARIEDHLQYFSEHLARYVRERQEGLEVMRIEEWMDLYRRNEHARGRHFVVHQHDHPVAGVHYDLRLQISESSSISFAIMYGLPGNPNSRRLNRNATETRVHNLWNHLVETASSQTGSLLIWDTGEYSILPFHEKSSKTTDDEDSDRSSISSSPPPSNSMSESEKLHHAFQNREIRLRLHGHRLPPNYTISLRLLPGNNRDSQPKKPVRKRRRRPSAHPSKAPSTSDEDSDFDTAPTHTPTKIVGSADGNTSSTDGKSKIRKELAQEIAEEEPETVRLNNAYPGAVNSIGSIHQRRWFLSMDRRASGFVPVATGEGGRRWVRVDRGNGGGDGGGDDRRAGDVEGEGEGGFLVRGRDVERSVLTGRNADEVMSDEGVRGFVGRRGWRAVVE